MFDGFRFHAVELLSSARFAAAFETFLRLLLFDSEKVRAISSNLTTVKQVILCNEGP